MLKKDDDNNIQNQVLVNRDLIGKYGTAWQALAIFHVQSERLQQQNILSFKPGPTALATTRIIDFNPLASFRVLFDGATRRNIRICTVAEIHGISDKINWDMTLSDLDKSSGRVL